MPDSITVECWNCSARSTDEPMPLSRHSHCRSCGEALHSCRQCARFDGHASDQCLERDADPPNDKTIANFCDWFVLRPQAAGTVGSTNPAERSALDALFNRETPIDARPGTKDKLNDLFK